MVRMCALLRSRASVHVSLLEADVVAELHRHVERVMTWPVNDRDVLESVLGLGVTGVISDEAAVLAEVIARRAR
jgi:glycerophosphoryl diester phosphodiesterase